MGVYFLKTFQTRGLQFFEKETPSQVFSGEFCKTPRGNCFLQHIIVFEIRSDERNTDDCR